MFGSAAISSPEPDGKSYFLADKSVGWVAVGASLFAANISSEHFIGLAVRRELGSCGRPLEWLAAYVHDPSWVFVPFYCGPTSHDAEFWNAATVCLPLVLTSVSILAYIFTKISVSLLRGGIVLREVLGWDFYTSALVMVVARGLHDLRWSGRGHLHGAAAGGVLLAGAIA